MSKCVQCGTELKPGAKFCPVCGRKAEMPEQLVSCPQCGTLLRAGAKFCRSCGAPVTDSDQTVSGINSVSGGASGGSSAGGTGSAGDGVIGAGAASVLNQAKDSAKTETPPIRSDREGTAEAKDRIGREDREEGKDRPAEDASTSRRATRCPRCGRNVTPGSAACPFCKAPLPRTGTSSFDEREAPIRETKNRRKLWISLAIGGTVLLGLIAALIIFRDDIFGSRSGRSTAEPANYGTMEAAANRPVDRQDTEATSATRWNWPARPQEDEEPAPNTIRSYSWEEIETILSLHYGGDIEKIGEDDAFYYIEIRDPDTGNARYGLRAARATGEIVVSADYTASADTAAAPETEDGGVPENEQIHVGAVQPDTVANYMSSRVSKTTYSYTVVDLKTGRYSGSDNQEDPMSSSVLIGIPVMYAVNRMAENGELSLSDSVSIQNLGGGGRGTMTSTRMTVEELLRYMLQASSGAAINNLANYIGMDRVNRICHDAGYDSVSFVNYIASPYITDYSSSDNYVSTRDICGMMYELYNSDGPIDRRFLENNFGITMGTDKNDGLGKRVSGTLGSFNGRKETKYNDLILVERNNKAYAVVMMAHGDKYTAIMNAMDGIGDYVDGKVME